MSVNTESTPRPVPTAGSAGTARLRQASLGVLVLIVIEYVIGVYVNLYVTIPKADQGGDLGSAISNGPAWMSVHGVVGLLLGLGALGVLVRAVIARHWAIVALSAVGLFALVFASVTGTSFTTTGDDADSMAMSAMTGVALVCYAVNLYLLPAGRRRG